MPFDMSQLTAGIVCGLRNLVGPNSPVQGQVVAWPDLDGVFGLLVSHHVAPHVEGCQVLHGRVGVAPGGWAIVWRSPNSPECTLIDAIHEHTLLISQAPRSKSSSGVSGGAHPDVAVSLDLEQARRL